MNVIVVALTTDYANSKYIPRHRYSKVKSIENTEATK